MVNITQRLLAKDPLTNGYVVNVVNCADATVTYGYAISKNKKHDIIACKGRKQPARCYMINIKFKPTGIITPKNGYVLGSLSFLAFVGFMFFRDINLKKTLPENQYNDESGHKQVFTMGSISLNADTRKLIVKVNSIDLTKI